MAAATLTLGWLVVLGTFKTNRGVTAEPDSAKEDVVSREEKPTEMVSPDGSYTLTLENTPEDENKVKQVFFIKTEDENEPIEIYEEISDENNLIEIPYNTFSPTNKYIFLKKLDTAGVKHLVLRTDGEKISEDLPYEDVEQYFYDRYGTDFVITDATGWGGYNLLVINTNYENGKVGPSWWFNPVNHSFIRLTNRFN